MVLVKMVVPLSQHPGTLLQTSSSKYQWIHLSTWYFFFQFIVTLRILFYFFSFPFNLTWFSCDSRGIGDVGIGIVIGNYYRNCFNFYVQKFSSPAKCQRITNSDYIFLFFDIHLFTYFYSFHICLLVSFLPLIIHYYLFFCYGHITIKHRFSSGQRNDSEGWHLWDTSWCKVLDRR